MIRVAAVGDLHYDSRTRSTLQSQFASLSDRADLFLIAGDLTQSGGVEEVNALVSDLSAVSIPIVAVLGNHDFHQNNQIQLLNVLREHGITALEGESVVINHQDKKIGVMGLKGFGGGFSGACITEFGEPEVKSFAHHSRVQAEVLRSGLENLEADYKFALLHFSPVEETLLGEKKEIYPFLGSYLLAEAIDSFSDVDGVFHGHAHLGVEKGVTPGGVPVRNVAQNVIRHAYKIYTFT